MSNKTESRNEEYLKAIITCDNSNLPKPESRVEQYLEYIARNGLIGGNVEYPNILLDDDGNVLLSDDDTAMLK